MKSPSFGKLHLSDICLPDSFGKLRNGYSRQSYVIHDETVLNLRGMFAVSISSIYAKIMLRLQSSSKENLIKIVLVRTSIVSMHLKNFRAKMISLFIKLFFTYFLFIKLIIKK